ncbi:HAD-IA family hydrolase [Mesorhizobium ciceri]|uniref:HAD-IA family hydrolase n=1 Tax=Mesorhizobium TaxID=68287 RepID=UPI0004788C1E|nr:HAD-IA family hydrolase [Mesorhizobium ciceri]
MPNVFLFDLDMTLVDSSALAHLRRSQMWEAVRQNMNLIRAFPAQGRAAPHELPALLRADGQAVGIVTSSPEWYATAVLQQFRIPYDVLVSYGDTENHKPDPAPIEEALRRLGIAASRESLYIGDDVGDVEAAYHAGLASVAVRWGPASIFELSSSAPDIFMSKASTLLRRDRIGGRGYIGEALTSRWPFHSHWGSILHCDDEPVVYALGRYFPASDPRHATSALSAAVLSLKNNDSQAQILGECVGRAVALFDWNPDCIIPVPMKPSQERNRFKELLESASDHFDEDIEVELSGLKTVKEIDGYKQMNALQRAEAIKDAFDTDYTWSGAKILLLDDVYTTGETTRECVRILNANGAGEVRVMAIAKDQRVFSRKTCSACGRSMKIRENHTTHEKFWGCSGYPDHCRHTEDF